MLELTFLITIALLTLSIITLVSVRMLLRTTGTAPTVFPPPQGAPRLPHQAQPAQPQPLVQTLPLGQTQFAPPQGAPHLPAAAVAAMPTPTPMPYAPPAPRPRGSAESVIGKNLIGIIAAALVFIGLVFLGFLVVPMLTDALKIVLMFIISAALTAGGAVLVRRYPNTFTRILLGTGLGAFFISILLTHLWFNVIGDIAAFALLLVWTVVALFVARLTNSLLVAIIAHAGMIVSVCAGYGAGLSDERLVPLMVYQFVSTAVIVGGNLLCCKRMYRVGLFATLLLMLYSSAVMWMQFWGAGAESATSLPLPLIASAFVVQFVGTSVLAALLFASCLRTQDRSIGLLLHAANLIIWLVALLLDVVLLVGRIAMTQVGSSTLFSNYNTVPPMLVVALAVLMIALILFVLARRVQGFDRSFETLTISLLVGAAVCALLVNLALMTVLINTSAAYVVTPLRLPWLIAPALLLMILVRFDYSKALHLFATLLLGAELLCAFVYSFGEVGRFVNSLCLSATAGNSNISEPFVSSLTPPLAYLPAAAELLWLVLLLALAWLCYRLLPAQHRTNASSRNTFTLGLAIVFEAGVLAIILGDPALSIGSFLSLVIMLISFACISLGFWQRSSHLRIFGLIVVMVCVLKLVTFDIAGLETLMRVIAFIGGGLICFGISALYTFAVRRYNA